jgi:hypothetical protein
VNAFTGRLAIGEPNCLHVEALNVSLNVTVDMLMISLVIVPMDLKVNFMGYSF